MDKFFVIHHNMFSKRSSQLKYVNLGTMLTMIHVADTPATVFDEQIGYRDNGKFALLTL